MALDFPVALELESRRQKLEHTLILAMDVYFSHVGTTPHANAYRIQEEMERKVGKDYPDTPEGRSAALRECAGDLAKFMRETAMYMGICGALRFLLTDVLHNEWDGESLRWTPVVSEELAALNYSLSFRVTKKLVEYKLYYLNNGIDIDSGAVQNPFYHE